MTDESERTQETSGRSEWKESVWIIIEIVLVTWIESKTRDNIIPWGESFVYPFFSLIISPHPFSAFLDFVFALFGFVGNSTFSLFPCTDKQSFISFKQFSRFPFNQNDQTNSYSKAEIQFPFLFVGHYFVHWVFNGKTLGTHEEQRKFYAHTQKKMGTHFFIWSIG